MNFLLIEIIKKNNECSGTIILEEGVEEETGARGTNTIMPPWMMPHLIR